MKKAMPKIIKTELGIIVNIINNIINSNAVIAFDIILVGRRKIAVYHAINIPPAIISSFKYLNSS
jgi:hypothetical protein